MSEIRFNDRVFVLGYTGSGKSELISSLMMPFIGGPQVVLIDTKPEFSIPDVTPVSDPAEIDWKQPIVHVQLEAPEVHEIDRLFKALRQRRRCLAVVHELSDLCEYSANKTPPVVSAYASKGRVFGLGLIGGTQRPVGVPKRLFTDADHVFVFATGFPEPSDRKAAATAAGLPERELEAKLGELQDKCGPHAFLHIDRRDRTVTPHAPLTDAERRAILVQRPELY